jgi:hypothetical protein
MEVSPQLFAVDAAGRAALEEEEEEEEEEEVCQRRVHVFCSKW